MNSFLYSVSKSLSSLLLTYTFPNKTVIKLTMGAFDAMIRVTTVTPHIVIRKQFLKNVFVVYRVAFRVDLSTKSLENNLYYS